MSDKDLISGKHLLGGFVGVGSIPTLCPGNRDLGTSLFGSFLLGMEGDPSV